MKPKGYGLSLIAIVLMTGVVHATQNEPDKKWRADAHFALLQFSGFDLVNPGFGVRAGRNINNWFALEGEVNILPRARSINVTNKFYPDLTAAEEATKTQLLAGVKVGKHWERMGLYAKARSGFLHVGEVTYHSSGACVAVYPPPRGCFENRRQFLFNFDVGGILEVRTSDRSFVRFDLTDSTIHYPSPGLAVIGPNRPNSIPTANTTHNLGVTAGVGFRF